MADIKVFRLMAVGPTSLLEGVDSDSVEIDNGEDLEPVMGQVLAPIDVFVKSISKTLNFTQSYVGLSGIVEHASFGEYWQAFSTAGALGAGGISVVGKAVQIPLSVRCSKGSVAKTTSRVVYMDAAPTIGTTTATPAGVTAQYLNGPSLFNGSALYGIESQELNFGLSVWFDVATGGKLYPTLFAIRQNVPTITIATTDLNVVAPYLVGAKIAANACTLKFMNTTGSAGYQYVMAAARVQGSIRNGIGTLSLTALNGATILSGATY